MNDETITDGAEAVVTDGDFQINARRRFLSAITGTAALGGAMLAGCSEGLESPLANEPTPTPTGTASPTPTATPSILALTDTDMLVLMTQLHYLQAEFYSRAVLGEALAPALVTGTGTAGTVSGPRQVTFTDSLLGEAMREIAAEKIDQVVRLRSVLGGATPARPALNLAVDATGTFTMYGINSMPAPTTAVPNPTATITDVYANQEQFLLGAFILEDAVMVAWRSVSTLMTNASNIDVAAGLLATSAFHTGIIRSQLFIRGAPSTSRLRENSILLSDLRDSYSPVDDDRGVAAGSSSTTRNTADINPSDGEGEIYGRNPDLTINVFYMTRAAATSGGFFPSGLNGVLRQSTAN
ncbi:ferritin-like domain-containing protein [Roseomonas aeriglobus]|nr:ferritin-like domain-containing protein [Roseomonas aeriglobus]